jgi:hypothetical protein
MISFASARERNHSRLRYSSRNLPLKLYAIPFCQGLPGSINAVPIPCARRSGTELLTIGAMVEHEVVRPDPGLVRMALVAAAEPL